MAENVNKTSGTLKSAKPGAGGGNTLDHPVIGIVKDNIDPTRSGKIRVQIEGNTNKESNNSEGWVTVQYLSTYFGMVKPTAGQSGNGDYVGNPSAYGQWQSPPDIGTKVLCIFAEGDPSRGYYIGCVVEPEAMQMVPAIGSSDNVVPNQGEAQGLAGASRLPVTSINTNNKSVSDSTNYLDAPKPVHSYTASIMSQQGIIRDPIRGPISSSAAREPVSRVGWGVATPGRPIMEGGYTDENLPQNLENNNNQEQLKVTARRGGHSIVMDDGDIIGRDQLIRIRTALGHQILMSDDGQTLMILHSNGQSYVELGKEGTVDIFSTNSFNVRTQGDINFHADQHINLHATENMNIQAKNLHINTEEDFKMRAGKKLQLYSVEDFTVKSLGAAAIKSDGQASLFSSSTTFINGSKINLNTGKPGVTPAKVPIITLISQTDTLNDEQKGFIAAPGKLLTVTTRTPAHYPWSAAGQGVDVKSTLDASKNLPVTPAAGVQKANQQGAATGAKAPAVATVASAPDTKTISKSMDKTVTNAVMGSVATSAATGPAKQAVSSGAAIVSTSSSSSSNTTTVTNSDGTTTTTTTASSSTKVVAVGSYAQTPNQLVSAGVLKPGSATLINGLAQNPTANVGSIMTKNLFTGKPGAIDLDSFIQDTSAQTKAMIDNMQAAQTTLSKVGVLTGKEAATQSAGMVMAAATVGVGATVDAVKQVSGIATTTLNNVGTAVNNIVPGVQGIANNLESSVAGITSQVNGALGQATNALNVIGAGVAAAGLANKLGGLGGISNSLKGLSSGLNNLGKSLGGLFGGGGGDGPSFTDLVESVKGPAGAAFTAIRDSLKPLQAGVPQNLSSIAKNSAATVAGISSKISGITNESIDDIQSLVSKNNLAAITDINALIENNTVAGIDGSFQQVKSQIGAMANDISSQSANLISQIGSSTTQLTNQFATEFGGNAQATVTSLSKSFNSISTNINQLPDNLASFKNPINLVNNVLSDIGSDITGITSTITTATQNLDNTLKNINTAVQDVSGMVGAAPAIATGNLKELASAATAVQSGASASLSAAMASGINNLPGGLAAAGAVINNIEGAVNALPGTEALGELVKNVQTSVVNTAQDIGNAIDSKLGSILGKEGGLTNLITSALPLGSAAGLLSSLSALGAGGPAKIKLPTISFNTFDRASLDSQVKALLENPKIPVPNLLGEIKKETIGQFEQLVKKNKDAFKIFDEIENWNDRIKDATDKLYELENSLPAGDKAIDAARNIVDSLVNDPSYVSLQKKADSIGDAFSDISSMMSNAGQTAANMLNTADLSKAITSVKSSALEVIQQSKTTTSVKTQTGQGSTSIEVLQSKTSSSQVDINNSIAGIVGPSTGLTFT